MTHRRKTPICLEQNRAGPELRRVWEGVDVGQGGTGFGLELGGAPEVCICICVCYAFALGCLWVENDTERRKLVLPVQYNGDESINSLRNSKCISYKKLGQDRGYISFSFGQPKTIGFFQCKNIKRAYWFCSLLWDLGIGFNASSSPWFVCFSVHRRGQGVMRQGGWKDVKAKAYAPVPWMVTLASNVPTLHWS